LGRHASANLTPASGRQDHTTSPSAAIVSRQRTLRLLTSPFGPALRSPRAQNAAASTASRSASVTIAIRPSVGGMARVLEVIWVRREWKYFWKQDWTGGISLIPQEIFPSSFRGNAKHRTRNLEIPRCAIAHLRPGANAPSRNVAFGLLRRFALSELRSALCSLIASRPSGDDPSCNPNLKVKPFPRPQCLVWGRSGHLSISR